MKILRSTFYRVWARPEKLGHIIAAVFLSETKTTLLPMYEFRDPYQDLHYMHDTEMERLVKGYRRHEGRHVRHHYQ
jgi:hypothetical protein